MPASPLKKRSIPFAYFGVACLLLLVGTAVFFRGRLGAEDRSARDLPSTSALTTPSFPPPVLANDGAERDWRSKLFANECPTPCAAGVTCSVTPENESWACKEGEQMCRECTSKIKCIPGKPDEPLADGEKWSLHLSQLRLEPKHTGVLPQPCQHEEKYWVCLRPEGQEWQCMSSTEACANGHQTEASVSVSTEDLVSRGLEVEVRVDAPDGEVVVARSQARYAAGLKRRALCNGLKMVVGSTKHHDVSFTFYLVSHFGISKEPHASLIDVPDSEQLAAAETGARVLRNAVSQWQLAKNEYDDCPTFTQLVDDRQLDESGSNEDPWGNSYMISCGEDAVVISSSGADGVRGTNDDITVPKGAAR